MATRNPKRRHASAKAAAKRPPTKPKPHRRFKPLLAIGEAADLLQNAGIPAALPSGDPDPGLLLFKDELGKEALSQFAQAIAKHRHIARAMDPPSV